jgi:hypothetical protein
MFARMIVTGLVALFLSSVTPRYSAGRTPTPQTTPAPSAHIQQPQPANPSKSPGAAIGLFCSALQ